MSLTDDRGTASSPSSSRGPYRDTPESITGMPKGIPFIIGNELAERFSFYGMKGILTVYMTKHLVDAAGNPAYMSDEDAKSYYHLFTAAAYFFPLLGSLISDILWGKYKTILILSLGYCLGHGCLALGDSGAGAGLLAPKTWLLIGLAFIAIGAGGIKPCVSAHVGDQFGERNKHLVSKIFSWFYFAINVGAMTSTLLTPVLLEKYGPWAAFGLPGILMAIATFVFWLGRNTFVHIPPGGKDRFLEETFSDDGKRALLNLAPLFLLFIPMFWSIFDQTGSAWVIQAEKLDRDFLGARWLESQVQAVNPFFILVLIPVFAYGLYPAIDKVWTMTPLRKIGIGLFTTAAAFAITGWLEMRIQSVAPERLQSIVAAEPDLFAGTDVDGLSLDDAVDTVTQPVWRTGPALAAIADRLEDGGRIPSDDADDEDGLTELLDRPFADVVDDLLATPLGESGVIALFEELAPADDDPTNADADADADGAAKDDDTASPLDRAKDAMLAPYWDTDELQSAMDGMPSIGWQFLAYLLLTAAEVMVSITSLEFAYTQAPKKMKSFIMGIYFLGVSLGNLFTSLVNKVISIFGGDGGGTVLDGANYYWFFTLLMVATSIVYIFFAKLYKGRTFIQGAADREIVESEAEAEGTGNV